MRLVKLIAGSEINIVDNSYVLLETEEFVKVLKMEQFYYVNRIDYIRF